MAQLRIKMKPTSGFTAGPAAAQESLSVTIITPNRTTARKVGNECLTMSFKLPQRYILHETGKETWQHMLELEVVEL
jgi:hypothetical protein